MDESTKQLAEIGAVLARISNYDNRKLDAAVARDWQVMIQRQLHGRWSMDEAMEVVLDHFALPSPPYFTVGLLMEGLRARFRLGEREIPVDVRVAKTRGLVAKDWPRDKPVPVEVAELLERFRAEARELAPAIESHDWESPLALDVGRRL